MKKNVSFIVIVIMTVCSLSAQDTISNVKALNFPFRKYGISIGNSAEFNGARLNLSDKNVSVINGLNLTFWLPRSNTHSVINGISVGVIPNAGKMRLINIGLIGIGAAKSLGGLTFGSLFLGSDYVDGVSLCGLYSEARFYNGLACSGLFLGSNKNLNGLACSGLLLVSDGNINGLTISPALVWNKEIYSGTILTLGYFYASCLKGLVVAGYANTLKTCGVTIALFNRTKELHGIQLGILNYAENNPKGLRLLPIMNMHWEKNKKSIDQDSNSDS